MIAVIDVAGNNLTSLVNAVHRLGFECELTHEHSRIKSASHVILPGVGAAAPAMQALRDYDLLELLPQLTQPLLGICLGMQLLYEHSEEGEVACLGLMKGRVQKILPILGCPVPHMGWNQLHWRKESLLQQDIAPNAYVYFVHSFAVATSEYTVASCTYSIELSAIVQQNNVYGMQFHPEKSAETGLILLRNFLTC